jgi:PleD family two-component response regulator
MLLLGIGLVILWLCLHAFQKVEDKGVGTFLNRGSFLRMLDLEIKRARRYQNSFCVLILKLSPVPGQEKGKGLQKCYHSLSIWLKGELREIDILGSLGDDQLAALLPYADLSGSRRVRSRLEGKLKNLDFRNDGYEVVIDQISFPKDGTVEDLSARLQG